MSDNENRKHQEACCKKSFFESLSDTARRALEDPTLAPVEVRKERMAVCGMCEFMAHNRCELCGCFLPAKSMQANATCPHDPPKWTECTSE
jgi:hypothetical protein